MATQQPYRPPTPSEVTLPDWARFQLERRFRIANAKGDEKAWNQTAQDYERAKTDPAFAELLASQGEWGDFQSGRWGKAGSYGAGAWAGGGLLARGGRRLAGTGKWVSKIPGVWPRAVGAGMQTVGSGAQALSYLGSAILGGLNVGQGLKRGFETRPISKQVLGYQTPELPWKFQTGLGAAETYFGSRWFPQEMRKLLGFKRQGVPLDPRGWLPRGGTGVPRYQPTLPSRPPRQIPARTGPLTPPRSPGGGIVSPGPVGPPQPWSPLTMRLPAVGETVGKGKILLPGPGFRGHSVWGQPISWPGAGAVGGGFSQISGGRGAQGYGPGAFSLLRPLTQAAKKVVPTRIPGSVTQAEGRVIGEGTGQVVNKATQIVSDGGVSEANAVIQAVKIVPPIKDTVKTVYTGIENKRFVDVLQQYVKTLNAGEPMMGFRGRVIGERNLGSRAFLLPATARLTQMFEKLTPKQFDDLITGSPEIQERLLATLLKEVGPLWASRPAGAKGTQALQQMWRGFDPTHLGPIEKLPLAKLRTLTKPYEDLLADIVKRHPQLGRVEPGGEIVYAKRAGETVAWGEREARRRVLEQAERYATDPAAEKALKAIRSAGLGEDEVKALTHFGNLGELAAAKKQLGIWKRGTAPFTDGLMDGTIDPNGAIGILIKNLGKNLTRQELLEAQTGQMVKNQFIVLRDLIHGYLGGMEVSQRSLTLAGKAPEGAYAAARKVSERLIPELREVGKVSPLRVGARGVDPATKVEGSAIDEALATPGRFLIDATRKNRPILNEVIEQLERANKALTIFLLSILGAHAFTQQGPPGAAPMPLRRAG
jgi:hypothetical protein